MTARFEQAETGRECELERSGTEVIERRLGSSVTEERRSFADEAAAVRAYFTRAAELVGSKWRVSPCALHDPAPNAGLARAVATGDPDAYAVYNDWLIDRGDQRGELAALRAAPVTPENTAAIAELEQRSPIELFGVLGALGPHWRAQFTMTWRHGWIYEIAARHRYFADGEAFFAANARDALHHALHAPMARFVRVLTLDDIFVRNIGDTLAACHVPHRIRGLRLLADSCGPGLLDAFPDLEELEVLRGVAGRGHPNVRRLKLTAFVRFWRDDIARPMERHWHFDHHGDWPALRELQLVFAGNVIHRVPPMEEDVRGLPRLPTVTTLTLTSDQPLPATLLAMAAGPQHYPALETLVLDAPISTQLRDMLIEGATNRGVRVRFLR